MASSQLQNGMEQSKNKVPTLISKSSDTYLHKNQHSNNLKTLSPSSGFKANIKCHTESSLYFDVARLLLSLTHAWNLDENLDMICLKNLKLLKPKFSICYGTISRKSIFFYFVY